MRKTEGLLDTHSKESECGEVTSCLCCRCIGCFRGQQPRPKHTTQDSLCVCTKDKKPEQSRQPQFLFQMRWQATSMCVWREWGSGARRGLSCGVRTCHHSPPLHRLTPPFHTHTHTTHSSSLSLSLSLARVVPSRRRVQRYVALDANQRG